MKKTLTARWLLWTLALALPVAPAAAQEQATPPPEQSAASPPRATGSASWTSDRADLAMGDVVTVLVDEYALAQANADNLDAQGRRRDIGLTGGTPSTRMGGVARTTHDVEDSRFGEAVRRETFRTEITARVVEVDGSSFRVEGTRRVKIDDHEREISIRGWIRAQDVSTSNTVDSWRMADAEIGYDANGDLGSAGGFWTKLFDIIIP